MTQPNRLAQPSAMSPETVLLWTTLTILVVLLGLVWAALGLASLLGAETGGDVPWNPFAMVLGLALGELTWPGAATVILIGLLVLLGLLAATPMVIRRYRRRRQSRVDVAAAHMGRDHDLAPLTHDGAARTAHRLGVRDAPGVPIGRAVTSGQQLYGSWEDMHIDIWGPRTGKTTARAIPAILEAPGSVLVTSNKRDVVDATRGPRAGSGPVWVFDPQRIAMEPPSWWWNPLSYVTDEVKAAQLAELFASGQMRDNAQTDAYFHPAGKDLLAGLLLAASVQGEPITEVHAWLTRDTDDTPAEILHRAGYPRTADMVSSAVAAPDKQRAGIYGTALQMANVLTNRQVTTWVTPPDDPHLPEFHPEEFLRHGGTLYSLSREGKGTAGPLVAALTVAVVEAAEERAAQLPGGRLDTPLLGVLDEVANVCRWSELPNMYSHYGSRGIVLMAILQSWSQGVEVWGQEGMRKLWSAANIKMYGGGVAESEFLTELSQLIGKHDLRSISASNSGDGSRSTTTQLHREDTLDIADLGAMPRGRAVVIPSGAPPTLVETTPWMSGPHAEVVQQSIDTHSPTGDQ